MKIALPLSVLFSCLFAIAPIAAASSNDAWAEFAATVDKACVKAASGQIDKGKAVVDPYGSEKYGLAIVTGRPSGIPKNQKIADISVICVYDKKTKATEVGGEIDLKKVSVRPKTR